MSEQKWTDDELQKRMKEWDVNQLTGITLTTSPREHIWSEETYTLECADGIIALTRPQALIVSDWFRTRAETYMSSKKEQVNERDTHFAGFAQLLAQEIVEIDDLFIETTSPDITAEIAQHIARRAYDLMIHTLYHSRYDREVPSVSIPDMTAWPEENE